MRRQRRRRSVLRRRQARADRRADFTGEAESSQASSRSEATVDWRTLGMLGAGALCMVGSLVLTAIDHPAPLAPVTLLASLGFGGLACIPLRGLFRTGSIGVNAFGRWRELRYSDEPLPFLINLAAALGLFSVSLVFAVASVVALAG